MRRPTKIEPEPKFTRRGVMMGALAGGALVVGWMAWPRVYSPNLAAAEGEGILNGFIKIGRDGHVTVVSPQVELGQGAYTIIAQIVADELGADWRTVAVEPAPINGLYDNLLLAAEWKSRWGPAPRLQVTGGSSTLREFEPRLRDAAAGARVLLCMAAADKWGSDWQSCEAEDGFIVQGKNRLRFGDVVADAVGFDLPDPIPRRTSGQRLSGRGVTRLDIPAKLDGSANYAADIRLPGMVFAAIRQGPPGDSLLKSFDAKAAERVRGFVSVVDTARWVAVTANSWWAANVALDAMKPKFVTGGVSRDTAKALSAALKEDGTVIASVGDVDGLLEGAKPVVRTYSAGFGPHAALEPMTATAEIKEDRMQLWIATQAPGLARAAAARATGISEDRITVHAMQVGGSFGRKYEVEVAAQVATIAQKLDRPVQLIWSRNEDIQQDRMRPAASAKMTARIGAAGQLEAWRAQIAAVDGMGEMIDRNLSGDRPHEAQEALAGDTHARAVSGGFPPYAILACELLHHPADLAVPTGKLRGGADGYTCFFTESFIDELAKEAGRDPFSYRMGLLAGNIRLAQCLTKVAMRGGWEGGGQGTNQGLACHVMQGSVIAVLAEAKMGDTGRAVVSKLTAVADVGRVMNPDIARQQIEGGLLFGLGLATGTEVTYAKGLPSPNRLGMMGLPRLADMPEISVELIRSTGAPGGIGELAVPPVAPAIANALFAGSGQRFRAMPFGQLRA